MLQKINTRVLRISSFVAVFIVLVGIVLFFSDKKELPGNAKKETPTNIALTNREQARFNPFVDSSDEVKNCIRGAIGEERFTELAGNERPATDKESMATASCARQFAGADTSQEKPEKTATTENNNIAKPQELPTPTSQSSPKPAQPAYSKTVVSDQQIELSGDQVLEIIDTHYVMKNDIHLRGNAKLLISNSLIEFKNDYAHEHILEAYDQSEVVIENSSIRSERPMNWDFRGSSGLLMINTKKIATDNTWPWMTFSGDSKAAVRGSKFDATVWERGDLSVEESETFIELVFENNSIVDERLSADRTNFLFPGDDERGISYRVDVRNSKIRGWGITVKAGSSITIRDGHRIISTVQVGWPWTNKTVTLDGLRQKVYQDQTWHIEDSTLRLVNTDVWFWSPGAFMDNTLIMRNSALSDLAFGGGDSTTIVEDSEIYFVRAVENQKFEIKNSRVESDVVATDNSIITLINTVVKGKIVERDSGRVIQK